MSQTTRQLLSGLALVAAALSVAGTFLLLTRVAKFSRTKHPTRRKQTATTLLFLVACGVGFLSVKAFTYALGLLLTG